jgi:hypothetical protein
MLLYKFSCYFGIKFNFLELFYVVSGWLEVGWGSIWIIFWEVDFSGPYFGNFNFWLNGDAERLADFRLKCHPHLHAVLPRFD